VVVAVPAANIFRAEGDTPASIETRGNRQSPLRNQQSASYFLTPDI